MKATKIRAYLIATALAVLVVPALVAVLGVDSHIVLADTVTPGNTNFTACLCGTTKVTIKVGSTTTTCNTSCVSGTTPASSSAPGTAVCGPVNAPTLTNCTTLGVATTCTASGNWNLCVTPTTAVLTGGTVSCSATIFGQHCTANSGAVTLNGTWDNPTSSSNFTNQSVSVTTSGGFPCPSGTSATFSADYCTNPALTVSDP